MRNIEQEIVYTQSLIDHQNEELEGLIGLTNSQLMEDYTAESQNYIDSLERKLKIQREELSKVNVSNVRKITTNKLVELKETFERRLVMLSKYKNHGKH